MTSGENYHNVVKDAPDWFVPMHYYFMF